MIKLPSALIKRPSAAGLDKIAIGAGLELKLASLCPGHC